MPITVVAGGQFGSEGKGKVAHYLAREMGANVAIRVGGPNSGHTVISDGGRPIVFKQLPTAALLPGVQCVLPAGSYIYPSLLLEEMRIANLPPERLSIDPNAVIITEHETAEESSSGLKSAIGSTLSGTGAAVARRINRREGVRLAGNEDSLSPFIRHTTSLLNERLRVNERVIIEGTQGFGLSALHSPYYPYATSRDTTAAAFVAEAGLSPLDVDDIVLVIRAFPIRVAGNSGPLPGEFSWSDLTEESGRKTPIIEYTSVTNAVRRVARFDAAIVRQAIMYNKPTRIVLNHLDYIDDRSTESFKHTERTFAFLRRVEDDICHSISYVGLGPSHLAQLKTA
ncbi:MAG: adenylosuccinate synthetase [Betaproteobacteria bacterium]|nr:adenylosuccinate synthetase [Betaproteobacteria bacterium]